MPSPEADQFVRECREAAASADISEHERMQLLEILEHYERVAPLQHYFDILKRAGPTKHNIARLLLERKPTVIERVIAWGGDRKI